MNIYCSVIWKVFNPKSNQSGLCSDVSNNFQFNFIFNSQYLIWSQVLHTFFFLFGSNCFYIFVKYLFHYSLKLFGKQNRLCFSKWINYQDLHVFLLLFFFKQNWNFTGKAWEFGKFNFISPDAWTSFKNCYPATLLGTTKIDWSSHKKIKNFFFWTIVVD